jgi:serine/threonine-protein kinase
MAFETRALTGKLLAQRYLVGELSRETAVSTQFVGEDTRTGSPINIDVVREGLGAESVAARALELEAMTACEIRHPNVVTPRDVGVLEDGSPFVITTRFSGETLEDRVCLSGRLPVGDVVRIGLDVLSALAAAHELDLAHGDLRPESVFLVERDGLVLQTLLSGFGNRSRAESLAPLGYTNLAFLAPEVASGASPSIASDIYACGAILYLAATGFPPYTAPSAFELSEAVRDGSFRTPSTFRPDLPARLVRVLVEALQTDPTRRFSSAREMLHALEVTRGAFGPAYAKCALESITRPLTPYKPVVSTDDEERRLLRSGMVPSLRTLTVGTDESLDPDATRIETNDERTSTMQLDEFLRLRSASR